MLTSILPIVIGFSSILLTFLLVLTRGNATLKKINNLSLKKDSIAFVTILFLLLSIGKINSQTNLNIFTRVPLVGENRFSVCGDEKFVEIRLENISSSLLLENIVAKVDLSSLPGFSYSGTLIPLGGVSVSVLDPSIPSFSIGDMNQGDTVRFRVGLTVDCGALPKVLSGTAANFDVDIDYTESGSPFTESKNTGNFEVVKPSLSIPSILGNPLSGKTGGFASIFDAALNYRDTIKVSVVNAGDGTLRNFVYWVKDHPLLTNEAVYVGNYLLPIIAVVGDTTFYEVDIDAIRSAMAGPYANDTAKFQFNEVLMFKEVWFVNECSTTFPDINRGVRYGCDGTALANCEQSVRNSGIEIWNFKTSLKFSNSLGFN
ncbi:MAG: hypothetical protein IPJ43_17805 [Saprospiraceae bacterium]|nr:hypothetical protein [Saprospiraceae bacterium]